MLQCRLIVVQDTPDTLPPLLLLLLLLNLQDSVMLAAMDGRPFVTMGSECREIDFERVWSNHIAKLAKRKKGSTDTGACACAQFR
jgi:hypothetical protein